MSGVASMHDAPVKTSGGDSACPVRLAICATHPIQYHAPLWRRMAALKGMHVRVLYGCDMSVRGYRDSGFGCAIRWDVPLLEGYESEFLSMDGSINRVGFFTPAGHGLDASMKRFAPDVILLTGYNSTFHMRALRAAARVGAAIVMRHEASDVAVIRHGAKSFVRDWILRRVYARIGRFAAIGVNARNHLLRLGVEPERIGHSPYCVDSDFMETQVGLWSPRREAIRAELGIGPEELAVVFSGKLIPRKDPLLMPKALRLLPDAIRGMTHVIVAGDGELRASLESELRNVVGGRAHFLGFLNQSEIGRAYAAADALIMTSKAGAGETWGLVVNEAMQFGLPAIVSDAAGCHPDLVVEGETGWVFKAGDAVSCANALRTAFSDIQVRKTSLAEAAMRGVQRCSLEAAAGGLADAAAIASRNR